MTRRKRYVRSRQNENQDRKRKRLLVAFLMLLLTGVAFTTATYAWFTSNNAIDTQDIDLKVTAATGISISANALDFKKTIHMSEVIAFAKNGCEGSTECTSRLQYPELLSPVSTVGLDGTRPSFYEASVSLTKHDTYGYLAQFGTAKENESYQLTNVCGGTTGDDKDCLRTAGKFLAFDFWIKSGSNYHLIIDGTHTKVQALTTDTKALESGIRFMFVKMGFSAEETDQVELYKMNTPAGYTIYNPYPYLHHNDSLMDTYPNTNTDNEATYGYYGVKKVPTTETITKYDADANVDTTSGTYIPFTYNFLKSGTVAANYQQFFQLIDGTDAHYAQAISDTDTSTPNGAGDTVLDVQAGITRVRCYVWLEGQDVDTVDAISFSKGMKLSVGFLTNGTF